MSWRSDRGNAHEVNSNAELSAQSAERWQQLCDETRAENAARSERRPGCLRDSTMAGAAAGVVGCAGMLQLTRTRSAALRKLAGAGGMAFSGFVGFFMPFVFVSNVLRVRCQRKGLQKPPIPKRLADAADP